MNTSIWLLTLTVQGDTSVFAFSREFRATTALAAWCRHRWGQYGLQQTDPLPDNHLYAVRMYFKRFGASESFEIDLLQVDPESIVEDVPPNTRAGTPIASPR